MADFAINGSETLFAGQFSTSETAGFHSIQANNSEVWIRIFGDSFKIRSRQGGTTPFWVSVDGSAWSQPTFVNSPSATELSPELLPGTPTDDWHDVKIRLSNGYSGGGTKISTADGFVVTSSGGVAAIAAHSDYGDYETLGGSFSSTNWRHTYPGAYNGTSNFTDPIFYGAYPSGGTTAARSNYVEFYVDSSTAKLFVFSEKDYSATARTFSVWVDDVRQAPVVLEYPDEGTYGLSGSYSVPGSGTRKVRISNLISLHSIVIDGAFVATPIEAPDFKIGWSGDSVTAGDSVSTAADASGNWPHLLDVYLDGAVTVLNRGLSGDTAAAWNAAASGAGRIADFPTDLDLVVANMSVNDAAGAAADAAAMQVHYELYYEKLLARCPDATILAVPQLPYQSTNRAAIVGVIEDAVTAVDDPRLIYVSSDNWTSSINEGSHPKDIGKIEACGGGLAAINIAAQPSDADTVTINGTVFEFDSNASVSGGNTSVTIGGTLVETIDNLAAAIEAAGAAFSLIEKIIVTGDTTKQGVGIRGCTSLSESGTNLNVYGPHAEGWLTMLQEYLPSEETGYKNMLLLGVG